MESFTEKQKTLVGVFPDLPECQKAWEIVKKLASSGSDVSVYPNIFMIYLSNL